MWPNKAPILRHEEGSLGDTFCGLVLPWGKGGIILGGHAGPAPHGLCPLSLTLPEGQPGEARSRVGRPGQRPGQWQLGVGGVEVAEGGGQAISLAGSPLWRERAQQERRCRGLLVMVATNWPQDLERCCRVSPGLHALSCMGPAGGHGEQWGVWTLTCLFRDLSPNTGT